MKEGEGVNQRTYMHNHRPNDSVAMARGKGYWVLDRGGQRRDNGDVCNNVSHKEKQGIGFAQLSYVCILKRKLEARMCVSV